MSDLRNIKDYIKSLSNAELYKLRGVIDLEIYLSGLAIQRNKKRG